MKVVRFLYWLDKDNKPILNDFSSRGVMRFSSILYLVDDMFVSRAKEITPKSLFYKKIFRILHRKGKKKVMEHDQVWNILDVEESEELEVLVICHIICNLLEEMTRTDFINWINALFGIAMILFGIVIFIVDIFIIVAILPTLTSSTLIQVLICFWNIILFMCGVIAILIGVHEVLFYVLEERC